MRRTLILSILLCVAAFAAPVYDCGNLLLGGGKVSLAPAGKSIFKLDFSQDKAGYEVENFENKLTFSSGKHMGEDCLIIGRAPESKGKDTAWELKTMRFPVEAGERFVLAIRANGNVDMKAAKPYKGKYNNAVRWYDKDGNARPDADFKYGFNSMYDFWTDSFHNGIVPDGAVTAEILMGGDNPNVDFGQNLRIARLEFMHEGSFSKAGSFVSRCLRYEPGAKLSWDADCPAGTKVRLQVSVASETNGRIGEWKAFAGPDGKATSFFECTGVVVPKLVDNQAWLRYKVFLETANEKTPVVNSVAYGDAKDAKYFFGGNSSAGPFMNRVSKSPSPDLNQPLQFRFIGDNPVDAYNMVFSIDGVDCKKGLTWDRNGLFTYKPAKAWEPLPMESSLEKWVFVTGKTASMERKAINDGGRKGVRLSSDVEKGDTYFSMTSGYIAVKPGAPCTVSFYERHNLKMKHQAGKSCIYWFDRKLNRLGDPMRFKYEVEANDWTQVKLECNPPEGASILQIVFNLDNPNIYKGSYLDISDVEVRDADGNLARQAFNVHFASAKGRDLSGMEFDETIPFLIGEKSPDCGGRTTMRDDGFMLLDGKPFFPIGIGGITKKEFNNFSFENALQGLKDAGFNMAYVYAQGDGLVEFLNIAEKMGMYSSVRGIDDPVSTVLRFRNYKSVFTWAIGDDTSEHIPAKQERFMHNICHAIDDTRVTSQADVIIGNNYAPYVHSTDVFRVELYPIRAPQQTTNELPEVISDLHTVFRNVDEAGAPVKSIWGIVQYFDGWKGWKRFPTYDEFHAMTWLIIIHGANGVTFYTYGGTGANHGVTSTPERWENTRKVVGEVASLQNELTSRHAPVQPTVEIIEGKPLDSLQHPAVSCLLKTNDGGQLLLTANSSYEPVKAKFRLPKEYSLATLPFENRTVAISGREFVDAFAPLGVHIYRLK